MSKTDKDHKRIGEVSHKVVSLTGLPINPGAPIFIGETNIEHMKRKHPEDFEKYSDKIPEILSSPTYIAKHPDKDSIEYIKVYDEHVLVAVRVSSKGTLFVRTLFCMTTKKVERYQKASAFKKYD